LHKLHKRDVGDGTFLLYLGSHPPNPPSPYSELEAKLAQEFDAARQRQFMPGFGGKTAGLGFSGGGGGSVSGAGRSANGKG